MSQKERDIVVFKHEILTKEDIIHILSKSPYWEGMTQEQKLEVVREYERGINHGN